MLIGTALAYASEIQAQTADTTVYFDQITEIRKKNLGDLHSSFQERNKKMFGANKTLKALQSLSIREQYYMIGLELSDLEADMARSPDPTEIAYSDTTNIRAIRCAAYDAGEKSKNKVFKQEALEYPILFNTQHEVDIVFTIINSAHNEGDVTREKLDNQISVLNQAFKPINIQFKIRKVRVFNLAEYSRVWLNPDDGMVESSYYQMCESLLEEPVDFINVVVNNAAIYGEATFPWQDAYRTVYDNLLINQFTLPDSEFEGVTMMGKTLIHEMGHYLGLWHTFHYAGPDAGACDRLEYNGCQSYGDRVDDTPYQRYCHFYGCSTCDEDTNLGCEDCVKPKPCDSCPDQTGLDPTDNYMGYNPDECMVKFTPGQYSRMSLMFYAERLYLSQTYALIMGDR